MRYKRDKPLVKKIKELSKEEMALFSQPYIGPNVISARHDEVIGVITSSQEYKRKTMAAISASGAILVGGYETKPAIMRGIAVYRYDERDEPKGTPINVDLYRLDESTLSKIQPPFEGHRLPSLPDKIKSFLKRYVKK